MTLLSTTELLQIYDDIACTVVFIDDNADENYGLNMSNHEIATTICDAMGWEDFDLLNAVDWDKVLESDDDTVVLSYAFIAFLRMQVFDYAQSNGMADTDINVAMSTDAEHQYMRCLKKWLEMTGRDKTIFVQ